MDIRYIGPDRRRCQRKGWRSSVVGKFVGRLWYVVARSNTIQTRMLLFITATLWASALALPGDSFARPTFAYMARIASEDCWIAAFSLYAVVSFLRMFSDWNAPAWAFIINVLGATLFCTVAFSVVTLPGQNFPAGSAAHCAIALASIWVLIRTHVNSPTGWQHD